jgi:hypothetical protein
MLSFMSVYLLFGQSLKMLYYALKLMEEDVASGLGAVRQTLHAVRHPVAGGRLGSLRLWRRARARPYIWVLFICAAVRERIEKGF